MTAFSAPTRRDILIGATAMTAASLVGPAMAPSNAADLVLLNGSITDAEIAKLKADLTVVDGKVVYGAGAFATQDLNHVPPISPDWSPVILQGRDI